MYTEGKGDEERRDLWEDKKVPLEHRDCFVGDLGARVKRQCLFPRNTDGEYDENGTYIDPAVECNFKYNSQCQFSLGVGQFVKNRTAIGKRLPVFDYTALTMKSLSDGKTRPN